MCPPARSTPGSKNKGKSGSPCEVPGGGFPTRKNRKKTGGRAFFSKRVTDFPTFPLNPQQETSPPPVCFMARACFPTARHVCVKSVKRSPLSNGAPCHRRARKVPVKKHKSNARTYLCARQNARSPFPFRCTTLLGFLRCLHWLRAPSDRPPYEFSAC